MNSTQPEYCSLYDSKTNNYLNLGTSYQHVYKFAYVQQCATCMCTPTLAHVQVDTCCVGLPQYSPLSCKEYFP